jgi:hypothetical protein
MDTLKGIQYWETTAGIESLCAAIQDPNNPNLSHILRCKGKPEPPRRRICNKKGNWKFKAYRFMDLEKEEEVKKRIERVIPDLPDNLYIQIPITELKKLKLGWID